MTESEREDKVYFIFINQEFLDLYKSKRLNIYQIANWPDDVILKRYEDISKNIPIIKERKRLLREKAYLENTYNDKEEIDGEYGETDGFLGPTRENTFNKKR